MKTDKRTLDLIKQVKQQKSEIAKAERPSYLTNCTFSYVNGRLNDSININVETNIQNLVCIVAFLHEQERAYKDAAKVLELEAPEFKWNNFTPAEWTADIKARIGKIQIVSKKKKLEALETRLNAIISPEMRAELELEAISKELE